MKQLVAIIAIICCLPALAVETVLSPNSFIDLDEFDCQDKLKQKQLARYFMHRDNSIFSALNKDLDETISDDEFSCNNCNDKKKQVRKAVKKMYQQALNLASQYCTQMPDNNKLEIVQYFPKKPPKITNKTLWSDVKVGSEVNLLDLLFESDKPISKRDPATISYVKNRKDDKEHFAAKGGIYINRFIGKVNSDSSIGFGISFDRLNSTKKEDDIDNLSFKLGYSKYWPSENKNGVHFLTGAVVRTTDFDLDTNINTIEAKWTPAKFGPLLGSHFMIGDFEVQIQPSIGALWGKVSQPSPGTDLQKGDKYLKVGPELLIEVWPSKFLLGSSFVASFKSYHEQIEKENTSNLWTLKYILPIGDNFSLTLEYEDGENPINEVRLEKTSIKIGVEF